MDQIDLVKSTFEARTGQKAHSVHQYENVMNNRVYRVETDSRPYIFKIYSSRDWPEDGKTLFVSKKLSEHSIPHANILVFDREDRRFPGGYLIEECLPGTTADRLTLSANEMVALFQKLAALVSRIHRIKLTNYGYTGDGKAAGWETFSEYMADSLDDHASPLLRLIDANELEAVRQEIHQRLKVCDGFPSVLCHGDLSTKNILVDSDQITLIDWDDVQSLCWMADISRLTVWMRMQYGEDAAMTYRKGFLDSYEAEYGMDVFYETENLLHVWHGLGFLGFFIGKGIGKGKPEYEAVKAVLQSSFAKCGMEMPQCL